MLIHLAEQAPTPQRRSCIDRSATVAVADLDLTSDTGQDNFRLGDLWGGNLTNVGAQPSLRLTICASLTSAKQWNLLPDRSQGMVIPITAADYYDFFPSTLHNPGDIWVGLPTFGVLPVSHLSGLVITPACDLSNRKVETITYVPVLPVRDFLVSRSMMLEIKRAIEGQLDAANVGLLITIPEAYESVHASEIEAGLHLITEYLDQPNVSTKVRSALSRVASGLRLLGCICGVGEGESNLTDLRNLVGDKGFMDLLKRIITNGRSDVHFLPADNQKSEWTAISVHSLALFRYPLTLPIEVLDIAQRVAEDDWSSAVSRIRRVLPCVDLMPSRPMKRLRLLPRFGSDLVTRYTGMFGRLGSPDFTSETVSRFADEIRGGA